MSYTIVTGLLNINRAKWGTYYTRTFEAYLDYMSKVILRLNAPMIIFIDEQYHSMIDKARKHVGKTLVLSTTLEQTRLYPHLSRIQAIQQSKEYQDKVKLQDKDCPEYCEPLYNVAVNQKMDWLRQAALLNPWKTEYLVWLDAGFGHAKFVIPKRINWDISVITESLQPHQMFCMCLSEKMLTTHPDEYFCANQDFAVGQLLVTQTKNVVSIAAKYYQVIEEALASNITDDDQYHLAILSVKHPNIMSFMNVHKWDRCPDILLDNLRPALRVAVLLCGNLRSWDECTFKEWMQQYDLFATTYPQKFNFHPFIQKELQYFDDVIIDPQQVLGDSFIDIDVNNGDRDLPIEQTFHPQMKDIYHGYYQYTSIQRGLKLIQRYEDMCNFRYDVIIKTRFDIAYEQFITATMIREAMQDKILITHHGVYPADSVIITKRATLCALTEYALAQYTHPRNELSWTRPPHGILKGFAESINQPLIQKPIGKIKRPTIPQKSTKMEEHLPSIVGFHQRHLCIRGTTVALYDYALANETICDNVSVIFAQKNHPHNDAEVIEKFQNQFLVVFYDTFAELNTHIENLGITHMYAIKAGAQDGDYTPKVPMIIHSVFDCNQPHGIYTFVSKALAEKYNRPWLPHIVHPLTYQGREAYRRKLNIPLSAFVYGRYGGRETFSIDYVKEVIREDIDQHPGVYFLFCNTEQFIVHPRCIFVDKIVSLDEKGQFIDACDTMLHARKDGETFGLAVAEFALANKMVLTCPAVTSTDNEHLRHLKDRAILYSNKREFRQRVWDCPFAVPPTDNPYSIFTAEQVMQIFWSLFTTHTN